MFYLCLNIFLIFIIIKSAKNNHMLGVENERDLLDYVINKFSLIFYKFKSPYMLDFDSFNKNSVKFNTCYPSLYGLVLKNTLENKDIVSFKEKFNSNLGFFFYIENFNSKGNKTIYILSPNQEIIKTLHDNKKSKILSGLEILNLVKRSVFTSTNYMNNIFLSTQIFRQKRSLLKKYVYYAYKIIPPKFYTDKHKVSIRNATLWQTVDFYDNRITKYFPKIEKNKYASLNCILVAENKLDFDDFFCIQNNYYYSLLEKKDGIENILTTTPLKSRGSENLLVLTKRLFLRGRTDG
ncbi:hypothetical protein AVBRAN_a0013 (plasmid) [Campylobacter sp. RM12651]|nr:hypothetical protein AVBRAN_a0013 [Campylobacter sp. RM12651]